jgi:hypothetical protein
MSDDTRIHWVMVGTDSTRPLDTRMRAMAALRTMGYASDADGIAVLIAEDVARTSKPKARAKPLAKKVSAETPAFRAAPKTYSPAQRDKRIADLERQLEASTSMAAASQGINKDSAAALARMAAYVPRVWTASGGGVSGLATPTAPGAIQAHNTSALEEQRKALSDASIPHPTQGSHGHDGPLTPEQQRVLDKMMGRSTDDADRAKKIKEMGEQRGGVFVTPR